MFLKSPFGEAAIKYVCMYGTEIWKCWFLRRGANRSPRRKTSRSKGESQQETQPTYGVDTRIRTRATFVGGECSHSCASLDHSPLDTAAQKQFFFRLNVLKVNFLEHSRRHHCRTIVSVSGEQCRWNSSSPFLLWHFTDRSIIECHKTLYYSCVILASSAGLPFNIPS